MEIKEKIRKVYQKNGVSVDDDYIEYKMKNKEKVKQFMRIYKGEKIKSMNYIFGKDENNKRFTKTELSMVSKIDLFNRNVVEFYKHIYKKENREVNI